MRIRTAVDGVHLGKNELLINLTFFKRDGTFCGSDYFITQYKKIDHIWMIIKISDHAPHIPTGADKSDFIISVDVPGHPDNRPHLIM